MPVVAALAATLAAFAATPAAARTNAPTFALQPVGGQPYFVFDAASGSVAEGRIRVTNSGDRAGRARLYSVDATTGPTTGAAYLTEPGTGSGLAQWTRPEVASVRLQPGESKVVPFTVLIPWGMDAGDYLGGITADPGIRRGRAVKRNESSFRIDVRTLTVIAVQVRIPGPRVPALAIDGVRAGGIPSYQQLFVGLRNEGNVLVKGSGSVVVRDGDGRTLKRSRFPLDTFVPRTRVDYPVGVSGKALPRGTYRATVTVRYAGRTVRRSFEFKVDARAMREVYGSRAPTSGPGSAAELPFLAGAAVLLLLGVGASWLWFRRRLRRLEAERRENDLRRLELWSLDPEHFREPASLGDRDD
jgi:hypothetical protein